jgi:hypothetical protein
MAGEAGSTPVGLHCQVVRPQVATMPLSFLGRRQPSRQDMAAALGQIDGALCCHRDGDTLKALVQYRQAVARFESAYRRAVASGLPPTAARELSALGRAFADYWRHSQVFLARRHAGSAALWYAYRTALEPAVGDLQRRCAALPEPVRADGPVLALISRLLGLLGVGGRREVATRAMGPASGRSPSRP